MALIIVFDTETTGFPKDRLPLDHPDQPRLVQLACLLLEDDGTERASVSVLVDPGVPIPTAATAVHGIDNARAARCGIAERAALSIWGLLARRTALVVAHNIRFDMALIASAHARAGLTETYEAAHANRPRFCTMEAAAPTVNLPPTERMLRAGFDKPKAPKLGECIRHFFGEDHAGAHDAMADVRATARLFLHLRALEGAP